jgi:hypothetical protein
MFDGHAIVGGWVSLTVTVNEQPGPAESEQLTVVVPTGKTEPDVGLQMIIPPQAEPPSVGAGYLTVAPHWPGVFETL